MHPTSNRTPFVEPMVLALAVALALIGCSTASRDIKARTMVNAKADLQGYRTYAWAGGRTQFNDPQRRFAPPPLDMDAEIRHVVDRELRARRLVAVTEKPDALVFYLLIADATKQGPELRRRYGPYADISGLAEAALVVGLVDAKTNKAVWMGAARAPAFPQGRNARWSQARLHAALTAIFEPWKIDGR